MEAGLRDDWPDNAITLIVEMLKIVDGIRPRILLMSKNNDSRLCRSPISDGIVVPSTT